MSMENEGRVRSDQHVEKEVKNEDQGDHVLGNGLNKPNHVKVDDEGKLAVDGNDSIGSTLLVGSNTSSMKEKGFVEFASKSPSSMNHQANELEHAKAEMGQVREENERLKMYLDQITKEYKLLQMQLYETLKQDDAKNQSSIAVHENADDQETELVSLCLGRYSKPEIKCGKAKTPVADITDKDAKGGLSLTLDCMFDPPTEQQPRSSSPVNSSDETRDDTAETWPPSKAIKRNGEDDASLQQNIPAKKVRVSVRARCDTPTMNDGCQWRKYGQKIAKGNPCPRAYYRCTVAPLCPVRKQVQRCAEDMSILITTYEGTHNHPLPMSATAMASTTTAAASMILSGSSSSQVGQSQPSTSLPNMAADLYGLNLYLSSADNSKLKQFYVHNSSLSSSPSYPTITLDLAPGAPTNPYNRFSTSSTIPPASKFAISNGLSFASPSDGNNSMHWGNGILNYGNSGMSTSAPLSFGRNYQVGSSISLGRPAVESSVVYHPNLQKSSTQQYPVTADAVAAATKAITTDPNFQSALVAALSSIITTGASAGHGGASQGGIVDALAQKVKWDHHQSLTNGSNSGGNAFQSQAKNNVCANTYMNKNTLSSSQLDNGIVFLAPSLSFSSAAGSASTSVGEKKKENTD